MAATEDDKEEPKLKFPDKRRYDYWFDLEYTDEDGNKHMRPIPFYRPYRYYDSPEGEDCIRKAWYLTKIGFMFGILPGALYAWSRQWMNPPALERWQSMAKTALAGAGCGALYATTACGLVQYRKKDDYWNHAAAGFVPVIIIAPIIGPLTATYISLTASFVAGVKHHYHMKGWGPPLFNADTMYKSIMNRQRTFMLGDYTIRKFYQYEINEEGRKAFKTD